MEFITLIGNSDGSMMVAKDDPEFVKLRFIGGGRVSFSEINVDLKLDMVFGSLEDKKFFAEQEHALEDIIADLDDEGRDHSEIPKMIDQYILATASALLKAFEIGGYSW